MQSKSDDIPDESAYVDSFFLPGGILDPDDIIESNGDSTQLTSNIQIEKALKPDIYELPSIPVVAIYSPWRGGMSASPLRNTTSTPLPLSVGPSHCSPSIGTPVSSMIFDVVGNDLDANATSFVSKSSSNDWLPSVELPPILHPMISHVGHSPLPFPIASRSQTPAIVPPGFESTQLDSISGWIDVDPVANISHTPGITSLNYDRSPVSNGFHLNDHRDAQDSVSIESMPETTTDKNNEKADSVAEKADKNKVVLTESVESVIASNGSITKAVTVSYPSTQLSYSKVTLKNINGISKVVDVKHTAENPTVFKSARIGVIKPYTSRADRTVRRREKSVIKESPRKQNDRSDEDNDTKISNNGKFSKPKPDVDKVVPVSPHCDSNKVLVNNVVEADTDYDDDNQLQISSSLSKEEKFETPTKLRVSLDATNDWKYQKYHTSKQPGKNGVEQVLSTRSEISQTPPSSRSKSSKREKKLDASAKKISQVMTIEDIADEQTQEVVGQSDSEENAKTLIETSIDHEQEQNDHMVDMPSSVYANSREHPLTTLNKIAELRMRKLVSILGPIFSYIMFMTRIGCQSLLIIFLTIGYMFKFAADETTTHSVFGLFWGSPSVLCYYVFCLMPIVSTWLMDHVGNLPHFTPHLLSTISVYCICRVLSNVSTDSSSIKRKPGKRLPSISVGGNANNNAIKLSHQNSDTFGNEVCHVIRRIIVLGLPIGFLVDGFNNIDSSFMLLEVHNRMIIAYLLSLLRHGHILSPVTWVGWSIQILLSRYIPAGFMLHMLQFFLGLAFIRMVSIIRALRSSTLRDEAAVS